MGAVLGSIPSLSMIFFFASFYQSSHFLFIAKVAFIFATNTICPLFDLLIKYT